MQASKLRNRVKIFKLTSTRTKTGAAETTFSHFLTVWANFEPMSVKDILNAQAENSHAVARCVLRYREDIKGDMQIEHRGKRYRINGSPLADKDSGLEYMTLMLEAINT